MGETAATGRWGGWAFALLCLLSGSRWIAADVWPASGSTLRSGALACMLVAAVCAAWAWRRGGVKSEARRGGLLALVGAGVVAAPAVGAALRGAAGEPFQRAAALCFVPVVMTVMGWRRAGERAPLWPGLTAIAGAMLLFPLSLGLGLPGLAGLMVPVVAVAAACDAIDGMLSGGSAWWGCVWMAVGGAVGLAAVDGFRSAVSVERSAPVTWQGVGLDVVVVGLVLTAVFGLGGRRYAARFVLVPVVTIVEGMVVFRPDRVGRTVVGLLCLVIAAVGIWRREPAVEGELVLR